MGFSSTVVDASHCLAAFLHVECAVKRHRRAYLSVTSGRGREGKSDDRDHKSPAIRRRSNCVYLGYMKLLVSDP